MLAQWWLGADVNVGDDREEVLSDSSLFHLCIAGATFVEFEFNAAVTGNFSSHN